MAQDFNKKVMHQYLKDTNGRDINNSDELLPQYLQRPKNSQASASEEKEKSLNESVNELLEAISESDNIASPNNTVKNVVFTPKKWSSEKKKLLRLDKEGNNNEIPAGQEKIQSEECDDTFFDVLNSPIGFNDMPKSDKSMLKIINHKLKYVNIQNSNKFLASSNETRIKMLYNYHIAAAKFRTHLAKMSMNMVPLPKPIVAIESEPVVNPMIQSLKDGAQEELNEELYVSRSGRHTKRKVYNEDDSSQDELTNKRSKNDSWISKSPLKNKTPAKKTDSVSSTILQKSDKTHERNEKKGTLKAHNFHNKKLSNEEIMQKSSLFNDHKSRTEILVNSAIDEERKRRKAEEKLQQFSDSLHDDIMDNSSEEILSVDEDVEDISRKGLVPSVYGRKSINSRKRKEIALEPLNITTKKNTNKITSCDEKEANKSANNGIGRSQICGQAHNAVTPPLNSKGNKPKQITIACPLCGVSFPKDKVEWFYCCICTC
ncbi:uncharacterized protein LOC132708089 isoform X2 [Cylas formicarius]|uniref:uncharacterized protein LOC132708089 isoform X2 n=1 Tax=Cylas formicarius TaxID=197179 RepID=UPI002958BC54|nr:uncharacterized protein LOC132708089 isoform X2 [Cylas formicarius]